MVDDFGKAITVVIQSVIRLAPLGIFGLVVSTFSSGGLEALKDYAHLLGVLVGCMVLWRWWSTPSLSGRRPVATPTLWC